MAARVGDDDDLELEALRAVDREQPDDIGALLLGNRLELGGADDALLADEAHEALDVGPAQLLVRAGQPRQLAQVRVAAPPVPLREHREVVVVVGDHALAETLEREPRSETGQAVVALLERAEEPGVAIREARRQRALEPDEQGPALGSPPQVHERVVRHAHERRGENGDERLVVVAVVQEPQVGQEVDDLLLVVVVAAGRAKGREAELAESLFVELRVGSRREEEDDLARSRLAGVDEILDARRHVLGLGGAPVRAAVLVGRLVGDEQLDRGAEGRIGKAARSRERLERVAEVGREEVVDDVEHLGPRAVVLGQGKHAAGGFAALAKDVDVRVPEAVDRLELVADEEEVLGGEQVDQLALEPVRVLELVDEHRAEAPALAVADRRVIPQEVPRVQLEILEVERRLAVLGGCVGVGEAPQQLLEERPVSCRELVERRLLDRVARLLVAREPVTWPAPGRQVGEVDQPLGRGRALQQVERTRRALPGRLGLLHPGRVLEHAPRRLAQLLDPRLQRAAGRRSRGRAPGPRSAASRRRRSASAAARARRYVASSRIRSGSPDAQNASSACSNASPASTRDWFSSSTRKRGSMPASNGCAFSRRWQKPWIVEIQAPSSSRARSWRPSSASRRRIRPRSSPAARSVYVIASTESMGRPRSQTARTKRSTSTVVLPVPAPAETKTRPPASIAASCSSFGVPVSSTTVMTAPPGTSTTGRTTSGTESRPSGRAAPRPSGCARRNGRACSFARSVCAQNASSSR